MKSTLKIVFGVIGYAVFAVASVLILYQDRIPKTMCVFTLAGSLALLIYTLWFVFYSKED